MRTRSIILSLTSLLFMLATSSPAQTPAHFWSQRFGATGSDVGNDVAVDGSGNVLVTGSFQGTVDLGGGDLVSAGASDVFVAMYNSNGVHQWSKRFGSTGSDAGYTVAGDGSGNVVVAGFFVGTVDFGGGNLVSMGSADIFLAKFNSSGVLQWSQRFGSVGDDIGDDIAVDGSGNVVVTGYFEGTVNFGGGNLVSAGSFDIFLAEFNSSGVHQWSRRSGSTNADYGYAVTVDGSGNVATTGAFQGTVNFGGANLVGAGFYEIFVAKYNASGVHQWSQRFGSTGNDIGYGVAVDGSGSVVLTGYFQGTVNFGGGSVASAGLGDVFLARYNSSGTHQWSQRFGSAANDEGWAVAADGSGNVVVTGPFRGTVNFGGANLVSAGDADVFVARYAASGAHQWSQHFGGTGYDRGNADAFDGSGNVMVTGSFESTANFGGENLVSGGSSDIFVAQYGAVAAEPVLTSILDVGNDQGKRVRIQFTRSGHDVAEAATPVTQYEVYRRNDALPPATTESQPGSLPRSQLLDLGWVDAGSTPAHLADGYLMDAPTDADSTIAFGQHYSVYFVRAATASPGTFYDSPIDSGYSLDNLAPAVPQNLAFATGQLSWNESSAADFDFFSVYGSNTNLFVSATLIDYSVTPTLDVNAAPHTYYFVTATDFSGNEGKPAVVNTLSGIGDAPKSYVLSISAYPNPFNPTTTVRYTLPARGRVNIDVFDARGAHVAALLNEEKAAGAYTVTWAGQDDNGHAVGSGIYFARINSAAGMRSYKMTLLK